MFELLPPAGQDPLMHALEIVQADVDPAKVDLSVGVYKDGNGDSIVLPSVKAAEALLVRDQDSKSYLSPAGNSAFCAAIEPLLFGANAPRAPVTLQTVGGSGALRVAGEIIRQAHPGATVWIPDPSWANHRPLMQSADLVTRFYPYYDQATHALDFAAMLAALAAATPGDVVIVHGCCQNPSGADLTPDQWERLLELILDRGLVPLVDIAYQGFADGIEEDAAGLRLLAGRVPEMLVATSFSKNFGLYRDRVGALSVLAATHDQDEAVRRHALRAARTTYSMPPDHGAAVVARILGDDALRAQWQGEVANMRERICATRLRLAELLGANRYGYIANQNGMFSFLALTPEQVAALREQDHIYAVSTGRINLAGLTERNIERVAAAIRRVSGEP